MPDEIIVHDLSQQHKDSLEEKHAILPEVAQRWAYSSPTGQGIVFHWLDGEHEVWQGRTDDEKRRPGRLKYVWPKGTPLILWRVREPEGDAPILLVEGTCQVLAVASWLATGAGVYGIGGCDGWSKLDIDWAEGKAVYVTFDGDLTKNRNVYDAAEGLRARLLAEGATEVRFLLVPSRGVDGIDDVLSRMDARRRMAYLDRLVANSVEKLPRAPAKTRKTGAFFDQNGSLLAETLAKAIVAEHPGALTAESKIVLYRDGVYGGDDPFIEAQVGELLGEDHRDGYLRDAVGRLRGLLYTANRRVVERLPEPLLNVRNGLLDLRTLQLHPHTSELLTMVQLPVVWDARAVCPHYEAWMRVQLPEQWDDQEEVVSTMLDGTRTPLKAAILYGPSRSGKSTFIRLMEALIGSRNTSAVSLTQLAENRFMAAQVYGKRLNAASEITSGEIEDVKLFLKLTGDDPVTAERKFENPFEFHNLALFLFATNTLPMIAETSNAYSERMKPFCWGKSFAGQEDPRVEAAMLKELPGILVRLVHALRRFWERGSYQRTLAAVSVDFETRSNRVRQFVHERCRIWPVNGQRMLPEEQTTTKRDFSRAFNMWAEVQQNGKMGERKIFDRVLGVPGVEIVHRQRDRNEALNVTVRPASEPDNGHETHEPDPPKPTNRTFLEKSYQEGSLHSCVSGNPYTRKQLIAGREKEKENLETGTEQDCQTFPYGLPETHESHESRAAVTFDLETDDKNRLWSTDLGFVRLAGHARGDEPVQLAETPLELFVASQDEDTALVGHNIWGYDLLALAWHHGLSLGTLTGRVIDTMLLAMLADPPVARENGADFERAYDLDTLGQHYFGQGKDGDLKALAKRHGGYGAIPLDDPDYRAYLTRDVELTRRLYQVLPITPYALREMEVARRAAQMSLAGFRVDEPLLRQRIAHGQHTKAGALTTLQRDYGVPAMRKDGAEADSPLATEEGRVAVLTAFKRMGVSAWPWRTATGKSQIGGDALQALRSAHPDREDIAQLATLVETVLGVRTIYQTVADHLCPDGRVHPQVSLRQATGRWSITKPGLTVLGKREGRVTERAVFLPDADDHVLLSVDLSQVDARAVAALSGDDAYRRLFESGRDLWAENAVATGVSREQAKMMGHAWNYGASIRRLVAATGLSEETVATFDAGMRESYPGVVVWQAHVREQAQAGELLDNGWGRLMRPDPERAWTQAPALMGQGCARDIMMQGLLALPEDVACMVRAVVHDEVVLSVSKRDADALERLIIEALSFDFRGVPIVAQATGRGETWASCYTH